MKKELTRQQYLDLYYYMRLNRAVEDTMVKLFRQNKIVGGLYSSLGQEAISVGTAYALEKKDWLAPMIRNIGQKIVTMTWIGDGGSSTGVFHEGLNFAATQKAPFVLILENNQWAYSTPVRRQVPLENLADRAKAYGIPSYIVDGNDVVAMY